MDIIIDENTNRIINSLMYEKSMRILDVGCGIGDISFNLAQKINNNSTVLGIDIDENALNIARAKAKNESVNNVSFLKIDLNSMLLYEDKFDVIIGRRVLMYLKNPQKTVLLLSKYLKNDGIMIFQEHSSMNAKNENTLFPLHKKVDGWISNTVKAEGGNIHISNDLLKIFNNENIVQDKLICESIIQTPNNPLSLTRIVRAMKKRIIDNNISSEMEIDIETLEERLRIEREKINEIYFRENVFLIWASLRS